MHLSKYESKIQSFVTRPVFTAAEARSQGIPSRMLCHFCKSGRIERLGRGIYTDFSHDLDIDIQYEELLRVALSIPNGVICLYSALYYYNLTDYVMQECWIAIPHTSRAPKRLRTRIIRMRDIEIGQTEIQMGGYPLKIFDRERCVVDAFRYLNMEVAIKALKGYLIPEKGKKPDFRKLGRYADRFRVDLNKFIMALTT